MALSDAALFAHELDAAGRVTSSALSTLLRGARGEELCGHSLPWDEGAPAAAAAAVAARSLRADEDRACGALLGMAVGDALGAPLEFMAVRHRGTPPSLDDQGRLLPGASARNVFALKPGQWTDDTAMGLCLADSLLASGFRLRPSDLMLRFNAWWLAGYNNAFAHDDARHDRCVRAPPCAATLARRS